MIAALIDRARRDKRRAGLIVAGALIGIILLIVAIRMGGASGKQRTLAKAFENLVAAESYHAAASLDMKLPTRQNVNQQPLVDLFIDVEGDVVKQDGRPVLAGTMRQEARGRGMILFADGELRILRDSVAFRLDNLPTLLNPQGNLIDKWTYVDVPVFQTNNEGDVRAAFASMLQNTEYLGTDEPPGEQGDPMLHYKKNLNAEQEDALVQMMRQGVSGNRALNVLARLLRAYDVQEFDIWVDGGSKEIRVIHVVFGRPVAEGQAETVATLQLAFSDYGKQVAIDEPERELSVRPDVFGRIFGSGEIQELQ